MKKIIIKISGLLQITGAVMILFGGLFMFVLATEKTILASGISGILAVIGVIPLWLGISAEYWPDKTTQENLSTQ